ncbi:ribulokinase [Vallitalea guaymasensis]|uniref:Ribulokinase n=1 Tax=Vallitalea guaymasensis TaxID=1185412 RepID=A0A8J8M970_9FIRM|nr:ribulokinase [Vallitalea guaymasensis]QUH28662.1 ribulokinase [Vallitalea guaymasensis]
MEKKYCLGIDYGTQSCRALLVEVDTGNEIGDYEQSYPHAVMEEVLPDNITKLPPDWALQHPEDYLYCLSTVTKGVLEKYNVNTEDVIGVGVDFTACTIIPVDKNMEPLCFDEKYKSNPHAYVKLWKHHAAQKYADKINEVAKKRGETFPKLYGGKISSEWLIPKVMQIIDEAPEIYEATDQFIEAGDWVVYKLTGEVKRSSCFAGYKGLWHKRNGYPTKEFLGAIDEKYRNMVEDKISTDIYPLGDKAGEINQVGMNLTGLKQGTAVAVAIIDAHAAVPAAGICEKSKMLMIMGTSTCHMLLNKDEIIVPGIAGLVEDGILPDFIGYEAGQACVGDHFGWFVKNCISEKYINECKEKDINIHTLLTEKASKLRVGESGLIALDWWNGNRSVLVDADLTGLIMGCTLTTKPEEIYRALIEATAFGTKMIIDTFKEYGVEIKELYAAGGIAQKNSLMMQIYSDVTNMDIHICDSNQAVALGSAMFGAVAAGRDKGGYDTIIEAVDKMSKVKEEYYKPIRENNEIYEKLFNEYKLLHDYFGRGGNDVMKRLKDIKLSYK